MRNALKALGAALAVIALCSPLIFWPLDDLQTGDTELAQATVTVPPTVVVATTAPPGATTTTTETSSKPSTTTTTTEPPISITVAAVGDVLMHAAIIKSVEDMQTGSYDFRPVFAPTAPYLSAADYSVADLETCLAGPDVGYTGDPLLGPSTNLLFNSPGSLAYALRNAGIDLVTTANNHALDLGWDGLVGTLDRLDRSGLAHVGTYRSQAERDTPFIADIRGIKVAFLSYTSLVNHPLAGEDQKDYALNILDAGVVAKDAAIARMWGADVVIALLHWGDEFEREPDDTQTKIAGELLDSGVDVILGCHPHTVQPIDIEHVFEPSSWRVEDKYVAYSLGNFVSAQRYTDTDSDSGLIAYVHIVKDGVRTSVTGISYLPVYVQLSSEQSPVRYRVLPVLPGSTPNTDTTITATDSERMTEVWDDFRDMLYRPDENIAPFNPGDLGL